MPWFKVDDQATFQPKVIAAGNAAFGVWVRLGAYGNAQLTDGFVPESVARMVATRRELAKMCEAGLAHEVPGGWQLDELEHQPTRSEVLARRAELSAKRADAGRAGGLAKAAKHQQLQLPEHSPPSNLLDALPDADLAPTRPVPTDPVQTTVVDHTHVSGGGPSPSPAPISLARVNELWMARMNTGPFTQAIALVHERVEHYARSAKASGRSAETIAEAAIDAFARLADSFSAGYRPAKNGYKFADHWPRVEAMLDGAPLETRPQKASDGPTIVAGLDFAKKERP